MVDDLEGGDEAESHAEAEEAASVGNEADQGDLLVTLDTGYHLRRRECYVILNFQAFHVPNHITGSLMYTLTRAMFFLAYRKSSSLSSQSRVAVEAVPLPPTPPPPKPSPSGITSLFESSAGWSEAGSQ